MRRWFEHTDPSSGITFTVDLKEAIQDISTGHPIKIDESRHAKQNMRSYKSALIGMYPILFKVIHDYELMQKGLADDKPK